MAQSAKGIGVTISLTVESSSAYYGKATFGNSDWLDATMSLVDYGHRSVPNVFLTAPLQTTNAKTGTGSWNAAHFSNPQYDKLAAQYIAAVDLSTQRMIAGQIQTLLLDQTPIIYRVLLQLPDGHGQERDRRLPDRDRPHLPVQRDQELTGSRRRLAMALGVCQRTRSPRPARPRGERWSARPALPTDRCGHMLAF